LGALQCSARRRLRGLRLTGLDFGRKRGASASVLAYLTDMKTPLILAVAVLLAGCQPQTPDAAFGAKVRAYLLEHPEVIEEAIGKLQQAKMLEQAKAGAATVQRYRAQLERDPRDFVINPNGSVTVVQFFDHRCGYCKVVAPEVLKLARESPDVRVVFKEFPIFGEVSDTAARMSLTPQVKTRGAALHQAMMADNSLSEASLDSHLRDAGLDPAQVRRAADSPAIAAQIHETRLLAQALGLEGTPAFIVGDYVIPGADMDAVRTAIAKVRGQGLKRPSGNPT
jgi:protein-disulfide isomerase